MKFYLSSYRLGDKTEELKRMVPKGKIALIANARDYVSVDPKSLEESLKRNTKSLQDLGLEVELIDLKEYFGKKDKLKKKLEDVGAVFVLGGNVFILRQAMKLSGMDEILRNWDSNKEFLYAGYSAGGCVLAPSLKGMEIVDPLDTPYDEQKEIVWDGLELTDFRFIPHWKSDHPESADIDKEIEYCEQNNIPYKAIRDGEVIIIE